MYTKAPQLCPTLYGPINCSPPGSSVHGVLQARIIEWVAMPFSRGSFWPRDWTHISYISFISRKVLYHYHHLGSPSLDPIPHSTRRAFTLFSKEAKLTNLFWGIQGAQYPKPLASFIALWLSSISGSYRPLPYFSTSPCLFISFCYIWFVFYILLYIWNERGVFSYKYAITTWPKIPLADL